MKIAFIGQKRIPAKETSGVERHVNELASRLTERGHEVFVYVRNNYAGKRLIEYGGVKLIHLPSVATKHVGILSHTFLATLHVLFCDYDVVHYHSVIPSSLSFVVKFFKPKTILISTYYDQNYFHQKLNKFAKLCLRLAEYIACRIPDKTIVVSQSLGNLVKCKFRRETVVIPSGFNIFETEKIDALKKWGLVKNEYIIFAGRLTCREGIHCLVEAYENLYDNNLHRGKKLVIVGDELCADDYVKLLRCLVSGNKSIIFTGAQSKEILGQLFLHAYLFVQPSESEEFSAALLEAQAYGKAALVGGTPENLEVIGSNGFAFRSGDAKDLYDKLGKLLCEPALVYETGISAKIEISRKYDWEKITTQTESLYKSLINHKRASKQYAKYVQI